MTTAATPAERPELPQAFGRYLLLKRLSRGGMGEIFLGKVGEIQGFEKPVIIKKILPQLSADEEFIKRFIDEAQVAIKLTHANIAPVYEVGKVDGDYFLALEYVEGRDLRRLMARCGEDDLRLPPDLCLYIGRELANGLGYAHRKTDDSGQHLSLVHCDISPPNVMVSFEGEVKVIDFGIAKSAIRIAGSNPNIGFGKFGYMAPEQLLKGGIVDRRTDIYAAGVVLYELLTGQRLFQFPEGADYRQIARIVTRGEWVPASKRLPGLDPSLDPLVGKALATRAQDRYQTAEEFRDAIQAKLSQMNPTISSDALAQIMRRLFATEIMDERALIASTRQVNVGEYLDQIAESRSHTVTFARAAAPGKKSGPQSVPHPTATDSGARQPGGSRRVLVFGGLALAAMGVGGGSTLLVTAPWRKPPAKMQPKPLVPAPPVRPAQPSDPAPPPPALMEQVKVTPLAPLQPEPQRKVARAARSNPTGAPKPPLAQTPTSPAPAPQPEEPDVPTPAPPPRRPAVTEEQVAGKFRAVKGEYESFKSQYGPRLESQWNEITREWIFGKPGEKATRVNQMLDSLRREMNKAKSGG